MKLAIVSLSKEDNKRCDTPLEVVLPLEPVEDGSQERDSL